MHMRWYFKALITDVIIHIFHTSTINSLKKLKKILKHIIIIKDELIEPYKESFNLYIVFLP